MSKSDELEAAYLLACAHRDYETECAKVFDRTISALRAAEEELARVRKDAERLDFVERMQALRILSESMKYGNGWYCHTRVRLSKSERASSDYAAPNVRTAIDEAAQDAAIDAARHPAAEKGERK